MKKRKEKKIPLINFCYLVSKKVYEEKLNITNAICPKKKKEKKRRDDDI